MITKAWFSFNEYETEEEYDGKIENIGMLEDRAFEWLRDEQIETGKRTWNDIIFSTTSSGITFENGDLDIDHEFEEEW